MNDIDLGLLVFFREVRDTGTRPVSETTANLHPCVRPTSPLKSSLLLCRGRGSKVLV